MAERVSIYDLDVEYDVSYRDVKYPRLEFKTGRLLLVLPKNASVVETLKKHEEWIYRKSQDINPKTHVLSQNSRTAAGGHLGNYY